MNCAEVRARLPLLLYRDVDAAERGQLEKHLAECAGCGREYAALEGVRRRLGTLAAPEVHVDLPRLYRQAFEAQQRRSRRWRRVALLASGVAAALLAVAAATRLEVRFDSQHLVVRWGPPPSGPGVQPAQLLPNPPVVPRSPEAGPPPVTEEQLRLLSDLIRVLNDDVQAQDRRQQEIADGQARLQAAQQQNLQRLAALERAVSALYVRIQQGE